MKNETNVDPYVKWDNTCIKVLSKEHGAKVIEFWKSVGVNTMFLVGDKCYYYYGIFDGSFDYWSDNEYPKNKRILTLEEAIAIRDSARDVYVWNRDSETKTFPREMYVWNDDIKSASKTNVVFIAENHIMGCNVMCYNKNVWFSSSNAMEVEEYEAMMKKENENAELIKQIEKTEKELAELKSKLNK